MTNPDTIIAETIAIICQFEYKIQQAKQSLCGYPQFDPKSLFTYYSRSSYLNSLTAEQMNQTLQYQLPQSLKSSLYLWVWKYGIAGTMTYQKFLQFIAPKNSKSLKETIMLRSSSKIIESFLVYKFQGLLKMVLVMLTETEKLKRDLINQYDFNLKNVHEKATKYIKSQNGIVQFLNMNRIKIQQSRVKYLRNYLDKNSELYQEDFRDIFTPITKNNIVQNNKTLNRWINPQFLSNEQQINEECKNIKIDFLKVRYEPSKIGYFNTQSMDNQLNPIQDGNSVLISEKNFISNDKQNYQMQTSKFYNSIVESVKDNYMYKAVNQPAPQNSIPFLDLFGKTNKMRQSQSNLKPKLSQTYSNFNKVNLNTCNILDSFSKLPRGQVSNNQYKISKTKVKFQDDLSFVSQDAFKYY